MQVELKSNVMPRAQFLRKYVADADSKFIRNIIFIDEENQFIRQQEFARTCKGVR